MKPSSSGPRPWKPTGAQLLNRRLADHSSSVGAQVASHRPMHVLLQVASACNLDCYMCSEHLRPPELRHAQGLTALSMELFGRLEREVFPYASQLTLGIGGEPTISPHFLEYVERAFAANLEVHLLTNGTQLGKERMIEVVSRCVSYLGISLDAATRETYERIRLGSRWDRMLEHLHELAERRLAHPPEERTHLTLVFVLMKSNVHELPAFVELAHRVHAESVLGQHVIPVTEEGARESLIEEPERYARYRAEAIERGQRLGIDLRLPAPYEPGAKASAPPVAPAANEPFVVEPVDFAPHRPVPCSMPTLELFVLYDGRVFPCCHPHAHRKMQLGDLNVQSFAEIWNGTLMRNLRAGLQRGDVPLICRNCSIVHDPPPAYEDVDAILAGPDIAEYYGDRDLAPLASCAEQPDLVDSMHRAGVIEYVDQIEERQRYLESRVKRVDRVVNHPLIGLPFRVHGYLRDRSGS